MQLNFCKEYVFDLVFTCMLVSLLQHSLALSAILSALKIYSVYIFNAFIYIYMYIKNLATGAQLFLARAI